ncbi:gamma aminobutyric acid receptor subunit [Brachionus plicatilis]|uniref:Gamma aminobutyric acid receptor subunit n=1 Tax=Brachionus plicatilis TaxID=10195 RepID=A0A3M7QY73_BRAPC|nr:gamma aminobutyric acid receptor subunit [Brachionus plicatilis]
MGAYSPEKACTVEVESRVNFTKIGEIDTKNEKFAAEAYIECMWYDKKILKHFIEFNFLESSYFDDLNDIKIQFLKSNINRLQFNPEIYWSPDIYVENSIGSPKEASTFDFELIKQNQSLKSSIENFTVRITEKRQIEGFFYERLELNDFPVDLQELSIKLTSKKSVNEVILVENRTENSGVNKENFADQQQWELFDFVKISKNTFEDKWKKDVRSEFKVTCLVFRKYGFYLWNAYLLIFLITLLGFTIFSINPSTPQFRCQVTGLLLLTSINFRWIITQKLPSVSYLTLLDKYTIGCLIFLVLFSIWHAVVGSDILIPDIDKKKEIDCYFFLVSAVVFVLYHLFFIAWFIKKIFDIKQLKSRILNSNVDKTKPTEFIIELVEQFK